MLRARVMGVLILTLAGLAGTAPASADPTVSAGCVREGRYSAECGVSGVVTEVSTKPKGSGPSSGSGGSRVCKTRDGNEVPCEKDGGTWFESSLDYCKVENPQPSKEDPAWGGKTTGAVWVCNQTYGYLGHIRMWQPSAEPVQPDPETLAKQAVAQLGLRAIEMGIAPRTLETDPDSLGAVGVPNWMWVANPGPQTTEPQSRTVSENGWTVTIGSKLRQVVWDMGDGGPEVFCGVGVPYYVEYGIKEAPSCGYRYQKQGIYTVKATSQWDVTWSGLGRSGVIPLEFTTTGTVKIGEIQTVIVKTRP